MNWKNDGTLCAGNLTHDIATHCRNTYLKWLTFSSFMRPSNWTISSLRLSWRADILCSSSSLRCLRKKQVSSENSRVGHPSQFWEMNGLQKGTSLKRLADTQLLSKEQQQPEVYFLLEVILTSNTIKICSDTLAHLLWDNRPFNEIVPEGGCCSRCCVLPLTSLQTTNENQILTEKGQSSRSSGSRDSFVNFQKYWLP